MATTMSHQACDQARRALSSSNVWALRNLQVDQVGQSLVLSGRVDSYYHKQLAQELVRAAVGSCDLDNRVAVQADRVDIQTAD